MLQYLLILQRCSAFLKQLMTQTADHQQQIQYYQGLPDTVLDDGQTVKVIKVPQAPNGQPSGCGKYSKTSSGRDSHRFLILLLVRVMERLPI